MEARSEAPLWSDIFEVCDEGAGSLTRSVSESGVAAAAPLSTADATFAPAHSAFACVEARAELGAGRGPVWHPVALAALALGDGEADGESHSRAAIAYDCRLQPDQAEVAVKRLAATLTAAASQELIAAY